MNKTTEALKLAEEAFTQAILKMQKQDWKSNYPSELKRSQKALAAIREVLAESKPAPDGRIPKTVFTLDDISKAAEMGRQAGMIDALAEPVKQEPVAVISESAIGLVKLHSNGVSLPFDTPLYAAPVRTKDLTDDEAQKLWNDTSSIVPMWAHHLHFARAVIAADREKNK